MIDIIIQVVVGFILVLLPVLYSKTTVYKNELKRSPVEIAIKGVVLILYSSALVSVCWNFIYAPNPSVLTLIGLCVLGLLNITISSVGTIMLILSVQPFFERKYNELHKL